MRRNHSRWREKNIAVRFLKADFVAIVPYEMVDGEVKLAYEDYLWHGDAKFSPTELVLHSPMVNYLFDEDDEKVVFVRQELDEAPAA